MTTALPIDAHVRLDVHPTHSSAVTAVLTGSQAHIPHVGLEAANWTVVAENTLVLARIDHEEPYWAEKAAQQLGADGVSVEITPRLREAMAEEWTWADYPMPWCTRSEIREVSDAAQKIYDDIRHGQLLIHAHAEDGHTTVAVGTYLGSGKSVYLHGQDHLRQVADTFDSPAQALVAFEKVHGAAMRPGPAPMTDTERAAAQAGTSPPAAESGPPHPQPETVPAYAADAGDHDALLEAFLDAHGDWEKWRTWSDETTHAIHESQTLRIERVHEAHPRETAWTIAAYETPVSDRMWVLTATAATPAPVLQELLDHLADGDGWDTAVGAPVDEKTVAAATHPLSDAGWKHTVEGPGSAGRPPPGTRGSGSTLSPPSTQARTSPPGPSGPVQVPTDPPGPSLRPRTPQVRCWPTSPRPSPTEPAFATRRLRAANAGQSSAPPRRPCRRSRPAPQPAVHADHRHDRAGQHSAGSPVSQTGDPAHH